VTKERRLEALAEAVESMNSLGYVFSAVRHELGNPVNSVKMALTVLRANLSRFGLHQVEQYLDRSLSELGRVEDLLSSLKSYSLYEDVSPGPLLLDRFVSDFVRVFGDDYRRRGIDLSLEAGVGDLTVFADPRALRQILLNLVANAVEAVAENERPVVRLVTAPSAGGASLRVIDNGCGMTDEVLKNLFKPFHTTKAKGTGLGLVISSKMMARMEGLIDVDSRTGNGTILTLWFRLADPDG
jgi:signal transduction histidine kinase